MFRKQQSPVAIVHTTASGQSGTNLQLAATSGGHPFIRIVVAWLGITCPLCLILPLPWSDLQDLQTVASHLFIMLPVYVMVGVRVVYVMMVYYLLKPDHPTPLRYCMKACHQYMNLAYCLYLATFFVTYVGVLSLNVFMGYAHPDTAIAEAASKPSPPTIAQAGNASDYVRVSGVEEFEHTINLFVDLFLKTNVTWLLLSFFPFRKSVEDHFDLGRGSRF